MGDVVNIGDARRGRYVISDVGTFVAPKTDIAFEVHAYSLHEAACWLFQLHHEGVRLDPDAPKVLIKVLPRPPDPPPSPQPQKQLELLVNREFSLWLVWGWLKRIFLPRPRLVPK